MICYPLCTGGFNGIAFSGHDGWRIEFQIGRDIAPVIGAAMLNNFVGRLGEELNFLLWLLRLSFRQRCLCFCSLLHCFGWLGAEEVLPGFDAN